MIDTRGRYLVEFLRREDAPPLPAIVRVDDRTGHWLYPPTVAARVVIVVPPAAGSALNVSVDAVRPAGGPDVPCTPGVATPGPISGVPVPADTGEIASVSHLDDAPAICETPFVREGHLTMPPPRPVFADGVRQVAGTVKVRTSITADGHVDNVRVLSAPSPEVGGVVATAARGLTYTPKVFRCRGVPSTSFFSMRFGASPG
ncbi:MAG TPA: hypothetical protein VGD01_02455 [Candidatus Elarobacter sp.]